MNMLDDVIGNLFYTLFLDLKKLELLSCVLSYKTPILVQLVAKWVILFISYFVVSISLLPACNEVRCYDRLWLQTWIM